jgi:hypothetical protein
MAFRPTRFDSLNSPARRHVREEGDNIWRTIIASAAIAIVFVGIAAWYVIGARSDYVGERDKATLCLLHAQTPRAELTLLDQTDALAAGAGQRFARLIRHIRETLPRNGRLTIVPFGGDLGQSLQVAFDVCSPGLGSEADQLTEPVLRVQRDYEARFLTPLDETAAGLIVPRESDQSPIAAQILRAVNDPAIGWVGKERVLNLLTDGLENTAESHVYKDGIVILPPASANILRNVTVNYFELASAQHSALQTPATRATWKAWLEARGANVIMYAPGYATPSS